MRVWRIAGAAYPVWSGEGARIAGARWNPAGIPAIYTGTSYAIAALETLVHLGGMPRRFNYVAADIPNDASIEAVDLDRARSWLSDDLSPAQAYGTLWLRERRSLVLLVPSVVTGGLDSNAVINPAHPEFALCTHSQEMPVFWDKRLMVGRN
jgi:RES domain-containing protein